MIDSPRARRARRALTLVLAVAAALAPSACLIGSPVAAFSGEPYGMTRDDVGALRGRKGKIWSGAPVFAAVDIPFAAVLDTALLPISLIMWGLLSLGDEDEEEERGHSHGGVTHSHGDGEASHTHDD